MVKFENEKECVNQLMAAMKSGKDEDIKQAWENLHKSIAEQVKADFGDLQESHDASVLAQRGYRQLTSKERKWYNKVIDALKSKDPKQAFTAIIGSDKEEDLMPTTIIEDVFKDLVEEHPLLGAIQFVYVGYVTKWITNDHATQQAVWGEVTAEIAKEITSSFRVENLDQNKLSAFAVIEKGMLDLGPVFLDNYIRTVLKEAILAGLELGIVAGTGLKQPIGLIKNLNGDISQTDGYPNKAQVPVKSFSPEAYGALVAQMAKTENGKTRKIEKVGLICNQTDYLTKVMPATTVMTANGTYANNLFPFPTDVYVSNALEDGQAVLFLPKEYFLGMGGSKEGTIEYSDEYKFLEDQRVFKMKLYGAGKAYDNTCAIFLDISNLDPAYITVKNIETVVEA